LSAQTFDSNLGPMYLFIFRMRQLSVFRQFFDAIDHKSIRRSILLDQPQDALLFQGDGQRRKTNRVRGVSVRGPR